MSPWRQIGGFVARRRIAAGLDGVWVRGLDLARRSLVAGPVVFAATHVSWWDGLLLLLLDDALGGRGKAWMDAANLDRLSFFRALGAIPVHPGDPGRLRSDLAAATAHLRGPGESLWVFPQGRHRPSWLRPLVLGRGAEVVARQAGAALLPVALAYAFREAHHPSVFVHFDDPHPHGLEAGLVQGLARIDAHLANANPEFVPLCASRIVPPDRNLATRILAAGSRG